MLDSYRKLGHTIRYSLAFIFLLFLLMDLYSAQLVQSIFMLLIVIILLPQFDDLMKYYQVKIPFTVILLCVILLLSLYIMADDASNPTQHQPAEIIIHPLPAHDNNTSSPNNSIQVEIT